MPAGPGVLILGGATASGKTEFAIALAQRYGAEIVGADSRQIYRDMPIGTAAPTLEQRASVPHHLVGFLDPFERYSAARYVVDAAAAIAAIHARGKHAIVAGGTGFYLRALCGEVELAPQVEPQIRARVLHETQMHAVAVLHEWLRARDPQRAADISPGDIYRVTRALEVSFTRAQGSVGEPAARELPSLRTRGLRYRKVALRSDPATLAVRIAQRTDVMLAAGLVEEAERIGADAVAADAVGYREALAFIRGWLTLAELRATLARATRRYAKRQLTWFRAEPELHWIDNRDDDAAANAIGDLGW